eukprot:5848106-Prymnesium_polylepis.1
MVRAGCSASERMSTCGSARQFVCWNCRRSSGGSSSRLPVQPRLVPIHDSPHGGAAEARATVAFVGAR